MVIHVKALKRSVLYNTLHPNEDNVSSWKFRYTKGKIKEDLAEIWYLAPVGHFSLHNCQNPGTVLTLNMHQWCYPIRHWWHHQIGNCTLIILRTKNWFLLTPSFSFIHRIFRNKGGKQFHLEFWPVHSKWISQQSFFKKCLTKCWQRKIIWFFLKNVINFQL